MRPSDQVLARLAQIFALDARPWEALLNDAAAIIGTSAGGMCLIGAGVSGASVFNPVGVFHDDPEQLANINDTPGFVWTVDERAARVLASGIPLVANAVGSRRRGSDSSMSWQDALGQSGRASHMLLPIRFAGSSVGLVVLARRPPANNYTRRDAGDLAGAIDVLALALRELSVGPTAETVARAVPELARSSVADLSQRERQVLVLLAQGLTSAEIAARLHLSPRTVEWHRAKILHKLDRPTRAQLVALGLSLRD